MNCQMIELEQRAEELEDCKAWNALENSGLMDEIETVSIHSYNLHNHPRNLFYYNHENNFCKADLSIWIITNVAEREVAKSKSFRK